LRWIGGLSRAREGRVPANAPVDSNKGGSFNGNLFWGGMGIQAIQLLGDFDGFPLIIDDLLGSDKYNDPKLQKDSNSFCPYKTAFQGAQR